MPSNADELLAVRFASGEPTGHACARSRIHRLGLWHVTVHLGSSIAPSTGRTDSFFKKGIFPSRHGPANWIQRLQATSAWAKPIRFENSRRSLGADPACASCRFSESGAGMRLRIRL